MFATTPPSGPLTVTAATHPAPTSSNPQNILRHMEMRCIGASRVNEPEEYAAVNELDRQRHFVRIDRTSDIEPVHAPTKIGRVGLRLQMPTNVVRWPRKRQCARGEHECNVRRREEDRYHHSNRAIY